MMRNRSMVIALLLTGLTALSCGDSGSGGTVGDGGNTGGSGDGSGAGGSSTGGSAAGGTSGATGGSAGSSTGGTGGATGGTTGTGGMAISCVTGANPQCNDGMDNDNDGKTDLLDPECVGPCDNDEASFSTGIPGDNVDACKQDCFFDGNSGMGDDGCDWNLKCDMANPGGTTCPYDMNYKNCPKMQSEKCIRNCRKLTPNGCDCFGCCAVPVAGGTRNVRLGGTCTADKFGDMTACPSCTQDTACVNTCEKCEICLGKPAPDPSCAPAPAPDGGTPGYDGGTPPDAGYPGQCAAGVTSCGPTGQVPANACPEGLYCITGCCIPYTVD